MSAVPNVKCKPASKSVVLHYASETESNANLPLQSKFYSGLCFWITAHLPDRLCVGPQAFIDKFRFNAKRASLVQSRIKAIERLGHSELIEEDPEYIFRFPAAEPVSPPILGFMDVDFGYPGGPTLFRNLNFGIDMESRFAMVGPNGKFSRTQTLSGSLQQYLWYLCYRDCIFCVTREP